MSDEERRSPVGRVLMAKPKLLASLGLASRTVRDVMRPMVARNERLRRFHFVGEV